MTPDPRQLLRQMFEAAIASAQPARCVPPHLPPPPRGRLVVIGAGKASAAMARAVEDHWQGPLEGLVVTRHGYSVPCRRIRIVEAAHPVPDAAGLAAAQAILEAVGGLTADDLVLCLISGGGSALLPLPLPGITLADKQAVNRALLASGASISEMNCLRRHLSAVKGGRLAAACHPARLLTLAISDVPGDNPMDIASGPTVADPSTCADALAIARRYGITLPEAVRAVLESGAGESVKPGDARLAGAEFRLVATPQRALEAAAEVARGAGVTPLILGDSLEGEAREVGKVMAGIARSAAQCGQPARPPCVLLSGGETTVTVRGAGRGGRNVEFLLALAIALGERHEVWSLAGDTDGVDGAEEVAGAIATPDTLARAWSRGIRALERLTDNDGHGFFAALGDQVVTGPTLTNVNDFRAVLVGGSPARRRETGNSMRIRIRHAGGTILARLDDTPTARALAKALPFTARASTWGEEVYFPAPVKVRRERDARQVVEPGTVCFWVEGNALALPWGATPIAREGECRLVTTCNLVGRIEGDPGQLATIAEGGAITVERA